MNEDEVFGADELVSLILEHRTRERVPTRRGNRVRRRADGEQIEHHQLAVVVPVAFEKSISVL